MSRLKRSSQPLEKAQRRLAALRSIAPNLDLGNGLSVSSFANQIQDTQAKLDAYNTVLSSVDQAYLAIQTADRALAELSERMLLGVAFKYGKYSPEYVMAGGTQRKTTRRRQPDPQPIATVAAAAAPPSLNGNGRTLVS